MSEWTSGPVQKGQLGRRLGLGLLFGFLVVLALAFIGDLRQVGGRMLHFRWSLFPVVLAFTLFNYILRFFKWHYYLGIMGIHSLGYRESARLFVAGFPLAVTPGKVGEAVKGIWLHNATGVAIAKGIAVVVAERISDGLAVLLLAIVGVAAYPRYWPAFITIFLVLVSLVVISQVRPLAMWILGVGERLPILRNISSDLRHFYEGSYTLFRPAALATAVGLGCISWFGEGAGLYLILIGLGVPGGWNTLVLAVFVLSFSIVIGAASTLPGGLGAAELSITGMLTFLLHLEPEVSAAATLFIRFATLWFGVTLGLITWGVSRQLFQIEGKQREAADGDPG